jgi:hypothetical protein
MHLGLARSGAQFPARLHSVDLPPIRKGNSHGLLRGTPQIAIHVTQSVDG